MSDFLDKLKTNASKTASAIGKKTSETAEKAKINGQIIKINSEMNKILGGLSRKYYEGWKNENVNFDEIDKICQLALDKEEQILALKSDLKNVGKEIKIVAAKPAAEVPEAKPELSIVKAEEEAEEPEAEAEVEEPEVLEPQEAAELAVDEQDLVGGADIAAEIAQAAAPEAQE
jgi:hypothetical protein